MRYLFIISLVLLYFNLLIADDKPIVAPDQANLIKHVKFLTSTPAPRNYQNLSSLNIAALYIDSLFRSCSRAVWVQPYYVAGNEYKNITCSFGPEEGERIIVGAHYDVFGNQPGADDNASGIAGLLELARLLSAHQPDLKYRIDLVAYTLEEPPFFRTGNMGSARHAKFLKANNIPVKLMICLEMIGYYDESAHSQSFPISILKWFYPDRGNFIAVVSNIQSWRAASRIKNIMHRHSEIEVCKLSAPSSIRGVDFSDHLNFWGNGYNAVMITNTAFFRNPNYHEITDTIDTLDFHKMAEVVKGVYFTLIHL